MKKELSELDRKKLIKKNHHQKIDYALAKAFVNDSDVYKLVKDFFAEYLNIDYEFTHEELNKELNKMFIEEKLKKDISLFLSRLSYMQFNSPEHPSQDQLRQMIKQFKEIISKLIVFEESKKKGFFEKIGAFFSKIFSSKKNSKIEKSKRQKKESTKIFDPKIMSKKEGSQNKKNLLEKGFEELEKSNSLEDSGSLPASSSIQKDIEEIQKNTKIFVEPEISISEIFSDIEKKISSNKIMDAKKSYKKLLQKYKSLPEHEKHQYFSKINQIYSELSK